MVKKIISVIETLLENYKKNTEARYVLHKKLELQWTTKQLLIKYKTFLTVSNIS